MYPLQLRGEKAEDANCNLLQQVSQGAYYLLPPTAVRFTEKNGGQNNVIEQQQQQVVQQQKHLACSFEIRKMRLTLTFENKQPSSFLLLNDDLPKNLKIYLVFPSDLPQGRPQVEMLSPLS